MERLDRRGMRGFVVAALVCVAIPNALRAQQVTPPSGRRPATRPSSATQPTRGETVNQRAQDLEMLSTVGRRGGRAETSDQRVASQFIQDFDRLVRIDTDTIAPMLVAESLDYKKLSQAAAEINQRAKRIKQTVTLSFNDKKSEKARDEADASKLKSLLPDLDLAMKSFFANPVFRVNSPNDAELRAAAGRDLEAIIKLSETVNKFAKSLNKSTTSTN